MRDPMVHGCGLIIMEVGKRGAVGVSEIQGHVLVAVIDSVQLLSIQELLHVVLHNGVLSNGSLLSPGRVEADNVTEGEDVLEFLALKRVPVHVDRSVGLSDAAPHQFFVGLRRGVYVRRHEGLLDDFT
eukprot:TRINITY_DN7626_c0_g1_i2.p1 TRINITY_DN7626_c0_g1~~TRINITY_DN7626_c0_g1_i2.p1  ORF type:complete len:128 (+),score=11.90 TRINITY_DN7626_c0_g1_i2:185-568(+)